jgi:hypothetical protein
MVPNSTKTVNSSNACGPSSRLSATSAICLNSPLQLR